MNEQHTPGPCTLREFDAVDGYFVLISDANGNLFAKAFDLRKARLIAAAPELLEALVMVRDADDDAIRDGLPRIPNPARARIDAAIAQATRGSA